MANKSGSGPWFKSPTIPWDGIANPFWSPKIFAVWREAWALSLAPCLHCHFLCIFMPAVFCRVVAGGFEIYQHGYTSHSFARMNSRSPFTSILSVVIVECPFDAVFQPGLLTSGAFQPQAFRGKCQPISAATSRALQISTVATWTFFLFSLVPTIVLMNACTNQFSSVIARTEISQPPRVTGSIISSSCMGTLWQRMKCRDARIPPTPTYDAMAGSTREPQSFSQRSLS